MDTRKQIPPHHLSAADAAFLYLERNGMPLHIASVCIFDGPIPFEKFVAHIKSKLALAPLYRKIAVVPSWSLEFPVWKDDQNFDIRRHIFRVTLETPGTEAQLEALASRLLSQVLDRDKALWEMHVVDGLQHGKGAIIWRVHHSLCDGVSAADLMKKILDTSAEASLKTRRIRTSAKSPRPSKEEDVLDGLAASVTHAIGNVMALESGLLDFAQNVISAKDRGSLNGLMDILPEYPASVERLPFNKPCTGTRKFCWASVPMADVQAIRAAEGGTVNDVVLAVLARALARYVKLHRQSVVKRFARVLCPVNLRAAEHDGNLGNQISFLPRALPLDERGPIEMLRAIAKRTETLKQSGALGLVGLAARLLAAVPPPLQALFWKNIPDFILPIPLFNMICTNVPGSSEPLYAGGRKLLAAYPQVPTGYDLGIGCAVHSYDGKLFLGLIADTDAAPDVDRFRDFLVQSFDELRRAALARKTRRPRKVSSRETKNREEPVARPAETPLETTNVELPEKERQEPAVAHAVEAA
jgi:diacylglycerol O-acyltransferase / wax synthase